MIIAKAEKTDLDAILKLQYLAYQSEAKLLNDFSIPPLKQTYEEIEQEYNKGLFLKAIDEEINEETNAENEIIGSVRAYIENDTAFIGKLIVHPNMQGKGIGTKLLLAIEKAYSVKRWELFTSNKSIRNIKLYERLGYVKFKEEKVSNDFSFVYLEKQL